MLVCLYSNECIKTYIKTKCQYFVFYGKEYFNIKNRHQGDKLPNIMAVAKIQKGTNFGLLKYSGKYKAHSIVVYHNKQK